MTDMHPVMNDTKWDELRLAMAGLEPGPKWRTRDRHSGYLSGWDAEWYYHFRIGGYDSIEWVEIRPAEPGQRAAIIEALRRIGLPGRTTDESITVFGHVEQGATIDWL